MKRAQLEHIIRAASTISDDDEIVVVGSQAVPGQFPDAPEELLVSVEPDVYPRHHPERWELIDGSMGELSPSHETEELERCAMLPPGWRMHVTID